MEPRRELSASDRRKIEREINRLKDAVHVDIALLHTWSGHLEEMTAGEALKQMERIRRDTILRSLLCLSYNWEGDGATTLSSEEITHTLLRNLEAAVRRFVGGAMDLITSKLSRLACDVSEYSVKIRAAAGALLQDAIELIDYGVDHLARGADTQPLVAAINYHLENLAKKEIDYYQRRMHRFGVYSSVVISNAEIEPKQTVESRQENATGSANEPAEGTSSGTNPRKAMGAYIEEVFTPTGGCFSRGIAKGAIPRSELPQVAVERVRAEVAKADSFVTGRTKWLPTELLEGRKTPEEVEATLCQEWKCWAWSVFVSILREWAEIGIDPKDFEALTQKQVENLSSHAEERVAAFVNGFQLTKGKVATAVRELLPGLGEAYREENRFRFSCFAAETHKQSPPTNSVEMPEDPGPLADEPPPIEADRGKAKDSTTGHKRRLHATVNCPMAARRMEAYMESKGIGQAEFAVQVGTTDRTLRAFRQTGKVRRDIFDAIAKAMGTTRETLLKPE